MWFNILKIITNTYKVLTLVSKYARYYPHIMLLNFLLGFTSGIIMFLDKFLKLSTAIGKFLCTVLVFLYKVVKVIVLFLIKARENSKSKVYNMNRKVDISSGTSGLKLTRQTKGSICYDIPIEFDVTLPPKLVTVVPTPFKVDCLEGVFLKIYSRSGLAANSHVSLFYSPAIIDSDYREYIKLIFINNSDQPITLKAGSFVAQLRICSKVGIDEALVVNNDTFHMVNEERTGGFGSTDKEEKAEETVEVASPVKESPPITES